MFQPTSNGVICDDAREIALDLKYLIMPADGMVIDFSKLDK